MDVKIIKTGEIIRRQGLFGYNAWPTVARTGKGELAAVWSGGRIKHLCPFGKVLLSRSRDDGDTWSAPQTVIDTPLDDRDGGIVVKGRQWLVTTFNNKVQNQRLWNSEAGIKDDIRKIISDRLDTITPQMQDENYGSLISVSEDGGQTFAPPYKSPVTAPHGPVLLDDGRYLYVGRLFDEEYAPDGESDGIYAMQSDDGYNWSKLVKICGKSDENVGLYCEPHAVQLPGGDILVGIRAHEKGKSDAAFTVYTSLSHDGGKTFSYPESLRFRGSPPHFCLLRDGRILLTYARRDINKGIYARISGDGRQWSEEFLLSATSSSGDCGYPSSVIREDGSIITVYYQLLDGDDNASVLYTIWQLL